MSRKAWVKPAFIETHLELYREDPERAHYMDLSGMGLSASVPTLLLTTTGHKSGAQKISPLNYQKVDDAFVVIASKGGYADHPYWYLNLTAHPEVVVQAGRNVCRARARTAHGEERARLWELMRRSYPPYDSYAELAGDREIPVVVLEPMR